MYTTRLGSFTSSCTLSFSMEGILACLVVLCSLAQCFLNSHRRQNIAEFSKILLPNSSMFRQHKGAECTLDTWNVDFHVMLIHRDYAICELQTIPGFKFRVLAFLRDEEQLQTVQSIASWSMDWHYSWTNSKSPNTIFHLREQWDQFSSKPT